MAGGRKRPGNKLSRQNPQKPALNLNRNSAPAAQIACSEAGASSTWEEQALKKMTALDLPHLD
jgi:hypothetical protein